MKDEIKIPIMGESISTAVIGTILKQSGAYVVDGEEIIELETEKVNQVLYASSKGVVQWQVKEEDTVSVGQVIGFIDTEATAPNQKETSEQSKNDTKKEKNIPQSEESKNKTAASSEISKEKAASPTKTSSISENKAPSFKTGHSKSEPTVSARLTKEHFVQELFEENAPEKKELGEEKQEPSQEFLRHKMTSIRKTIAKRLVESLHQSAMLTTFNEVDMSQVISLRTKYQETFVEKHSVKLGFMSFFVKAVVEALKEFPLINSFIEGEDIVQRTSYDIGIAVGGERGLVVPVLRKCDRLSFANIEKGILKLAKKAKEGKLQISDLQGGGFTITNGGIYGSLLSTPILNPPQSGILGMHNIVKRAVVIKEEIVARPMMYLALSYDHRIVDGREAVLFLVKIKEVIEDPSRLLFFEKDL